MFALKLYASCLASSHILNEWWTTRRRSNIKDLNMCASTDKNVIYDRIIYKQQQQQNKAKKISDQILGKERMHVCLRQVVQQEESKLW